MSILFFSLKDILLGLELVGNLFIQLKYFFKDFSNSNFKPINFFLKDLLKHVSQKESPGVFFYEIKECFFILLTFNILLIRFFTVTV